MPELVPSSFSPFALIVDPSSVHAAAQRVAALGLPRLVVKSLWDKEKSPEDIPGPRLKAPTRYSMR